jgi:hypothetical protein
MCNPKRLLSLFVSMFFVCGFAVNANTASSCGTAQDAFAEVMIGSSGINFMPKVNYAEMVVTVGRADGSVFQRTFDSGSTPYLDLASICGSTSRDGIYSYELRITPMMRQKIRGSEERAGLDRSIPRHQRALVQTGAFSVQNGAIVPPSGAQEGLSRTQDVLHYDDVIITGSLCVGFDCADGESFGFCTMKLKENNLQICFEDTSTGTFPTNDWKIQTNDSTSGGASYFTIWDTDGGRRPFTIEAGAPANSLYVEDYGRVGLGTSLPVLDLHIVSGDSPAIRLDQDTSSGYTAQVWDIAGNEANFFVRDTTGGSKLPFRIQPGTPTNTLTLKSDGKVGIGTWSPTYALEISRTGSAANLICNQTDGASGCIVADSSHVFIGAKTNHDFRLIANDSVKMTILTSGNVGIGTTTPSYPLHMSSGAYCSAGGTWTNSSSRALKENIQSLGSEEALNTLNNLSPVKFNYKADKSEKHVGFIAEEAPELVATKDKKGMSPMDVVAVLTKVVQEQQNFIQSQQKINAELQKKIAELEKK